jgi:murein L,D-transpeptidase YafK
LFRLIAWLVLLVGVGGTLAACGGLMIDTKALQPIPQPLLTRIAQIGSTPGAPMMIRIFKQSSELEVWKQSRDGDYRLLKTYSICKWSGDLGPKLKEADYQSPEGFYTITPALMNPNSHYYLAFNTGYPNKFDRAHGRTGSDVMVHGDCKSVGCFAMTDGEIAEIFALARETFKGGNRSFQLEIFPFRMTPEALARYARDPNMPFWQNLRTGYDIFELTHRPPSWDVCNKTYVFDAAARDGSPLDAAAPCPALETDPRLVAALATKQKAENAVIATKLAMIDAGEAKADRQAAEIAARDAAAKARGKAVGSFFSGIGSWFGGAGPEPVSAALPAGPAPVPAPPLKRG